MPGPYAAEPAPIRDIPEEVWRGFDRVVAGLRPKIRGGFNRSVKLLRSSFDLDLARDSLIIQHNLEQLISTPPALEAWRGASEELFDLYLGPRERREPDPDEISSLVIRHEPWNAERLEPGKAPVVQTMTSAGRIAARTTDPIRSGWWELRRMIEEMVAWAKLNAAARVTAIDDATRAGIREIVTSAFDFEEGTDRDAIARALRALDGTAGLRLGLDAPRQRTLMKFIDGLEPIPGSLPTRRREALSRRQKLLIDREYNRLFKARRATIARTESVTIGNEGQAITWEKAALDGELDTAAYVLLWVERTIACPRCLAMGGATREISGGLFVSDGTGPKGVEVTSVPDLHVNGVCQMITARRGDVAAPRQVSAEMTWDPLALLKAA